jgi:thymidylate kinase
MKGRGKFIVLEGLDRSGKSSVVKFIKEYLEKKIG